MNRAEHVAIVKAALAKGIPQGFSVEQLAEGIVNRVELKLEMEADMQDIGVTDFDEIRPARPAPVERRPDLDTLPPPLPDANLKQPSIIVAPREAVKEAPLRLPPPGAPRESANAPRRYWKQDHLREFLLDHLPESIAVHPEGRRAPVTLIRNIESLLGVDLVKVSYRLGEEANPSPSAVNLGGEDLPAMPVDTPVFATFSCFEKDQQVDQHMQTILDQAAQVYRPRPEHIESRAPRLTGPIRWDDRDPHDITDPLSGPTGKVY